MVARTGMSELITSLRGMCDAGTADYTVASGTYWTDDQLQEVLDRYRMTVNNEGLMMYPEGTYYYEYRFAWGDVERGSEFKIFDSAGSQIGTALYSVNYPAQTVTFASNTLGSAFYARYRTFDINASAADVWDIKSGHVASRFDIETDNHNLKRSQLSAQYARMAMQFRIRRRGVSGRDGGSYARMVRTDVNRN